MPEKFVVAFNRDRDFYHVPIALQKAEKLQTLVTDFYTPDWLPERWKKQQAFLKRRSTPHIPSSRTSSTLRALLLQFLIRLPIVSEVSRYKLFKKLDRILSNKAGHIAKKKDAHLLLYSGYAKEAFAGAGGGRTKRILFVYHPHAELPEEILEEDFKNSPEIAWSRNLHHLESKLSDNARLTEEISMADLVIVASSFTRKSIQHVLPDFSRIMVVPYGTREDYLDIPLEKSDGKRCRFLFVGQGVQRKGIHHLVKAWEQMTALNAEMAFVCSVLDPGIKESVSRLGITVKQNLSGEDLKKEFARSDVFIMPSLVEGFGLVYLEALAAGCFTIGSENTGLPDLQLPENVGDIVPSVSVDPIAKSMKSAWEKWKRGDLDKGKIRAVAASFSWDRFHQDVAQAVENT
ncbi:MAG: glycosyltransferase family 4 protein [Verrucomicrobiae bacterium]|nr:glycosyltransferase family 4 protein [Verrucomicrobiae bacterium]